MAQSLADRQQMMLTSRMGGLDQRRLSYLYEAVSAGSVRGGAERLRTSASALSRQIAKIEAELGLALLDRHGRGVLPTEAGKLLVDYFLEQRSRLETVVAQIQDLTAMRHGSVTLALGEGFLAEVMGEPLRLFAQRYPRLSIELLVGSTDEIVRHILDDRAHFGLAYNVPEDARLQVHAARHHAIRVVTRPTHQLASLGRDVTLRDLETCDIGMLPRAYGVRQVVLSAEQNGLARLQPRLTANSSSALLRFAEAWDGVVITTEFAVAEQIAQGRLVALRLPKGLLDGGEARLLTRRSRRLPVAAAHLLRDLRAKVGLFR